MAEPELKGTRQATVPSQQNPTDPQDPETATTNYTNYLHRPVEIVSALRALRNQQATVQLRLEGDSTVYTARILDVCEQELLIEDLVPRTGLRSMSAGARFSFSARAGGMYLHSEENTVRRADEDRGIPFFRIELPASVLFQQRRQAKRYRLPLQLTSAEATITLIRDVAADRDHGNVLEGRIVDISAGGCRVEIDGPIHPPVETPESLTCTVNMPKLLDVSADATIRHASYDKHTRMLVCGIEFTSMQITDRRRLDQFIQALSRVNVQSQDRAQSRVAV